MSATRHPEVRATVRVASLEGLTAEIFGPSRRHVGFTRHAILRAQVGYSRLAMARRFRGSHLRVTAKRSRLPHPYSGWHKTHMTDKTAGFANGLTNYGDRDFSFYLRRSFAQSMGYSRE